MANEVFTQSIPSYDREKVSRLNFVNSAVGEMICPVWTFEYYNNILKNSTPELDEQARAASVYFSILARNPQVTSNEETSFIPFEESYQPDYLLGSEFWLNFRPTDFKVGDVFAKTSAYSNYIKMLQTAPAKDVYLYNLYKLKTYLSKLNLTKGIEQTLAEQSRKLQGLKVQAQEAKAAAARSLAYSQINANMSEEERFAAAERQAKAKEEYKEAEENEKDIERRLTNITNGLPEDFGEGEGKGGINIALLAAIGVGAFFLLRR